MNVGTLTGSIEIEDQLSGALTIISDRVKKFASGFDSAFGAVVIGATVAVAAIAGITAAVTALGVRGSDVNDLSSTLDRFAGSSQNAERIMERMRQGTAETVTNFDLMKSSTKLLAAGVKLTADDFGTLTSAAFVLQNQGLGPTKDMLAMVSSAMLTGRTRSLEMAIGKMDLSKAEANYAKTLNISEKALTDIQKIEAKRIGILAALDERVKAAGAQQRDFGEQIEMVKAKMTNWLDRLSAAVAASPAVARAMDAIGAALKEAFGGSSEAAIQNVLGWIEKFANVVEDMAPGIVTTKDAIASFFGFLSDNWNLIKNSTLLVVAYHTSWAVFSMGSALVTSVVAGLRAIQLAVVASNATLLSNPYTAALLGIGVAAVAAKTRMDNFRDGQDAIAARAKDWTKNLTEYGKSIQLAKDGFKIDFKGMNITLPGEDEVGPPKSPPGNSVADEIQKIADALSGAALQQKVDDLTAAWKRLDPAQRAAAVSSGRLGAAVKALAADGAVLTGAFKAEEDRLAKVASGWAYLSVVMGANAKIKKEDTALIQANWDKELAALMSVIAARQAGVTAALATAASVRDTVMKATMSATDYAIYQAGRQRDLTIAALAPLRLLIPEIYKNAIDNLDVIWNEMVLDAEAAGRKAGQAIGNAAGESEGKGGDVGAATGSAFSVAFAASLSNIGNVIVGALQGGGNIWQSVLGSLANDMGSYFSQKFAESAKSSASKAGASAAGAELAGAMVGAMYAPIAGFVANVWLNIFKDAPAMPNAPWMDAMDALKARGAEVLKVFQDALRLASELNAAMSGQIDVDAFAAQIGQFQTREELTEIANNWAAMYDAMLASGLYTAATLADAWKRYQDALEAAAGVVVEPPSAIDDIVAGFPTRAQLEEAASNAEAAYIRIRDSGLYTAGQVERAFLAWQDALVEAGDTGTIALRKIDDEMKGLLKSIEDEAPEEVMGVIEQAARARLDALQQERDALTQAGIEQTLTAEEEAAAAAEASAQKAFEMAKKRADQLDDDLRLLFSRGYDIPLRFTGVPGTPGGNGPPPPPPPTQSSSSFGLQRSPSGGTAVIEIDGREWARMMVPEFADEVRRQRLGGR